MSLAGKPSSSGPAANVRANELANAALRETERGAYDSAFSLYAEAVTLAPADADLLFNYASLARINGSLKLAESLLLRVVDLRPVDSAAWLLLSGLRRWHADDNHIPALRKALAAGEVPRQRVELLYALAKECEDLQDFAAAREYLLQGAALRRQHLRYDVRDDVATMNALQKMVTDIAGAERDAKTQNAQVHNPAPTPIFILSLPRAGSTLLERMLSTDDRVHAAGELPYFPQLIGRGLQQAFIAQNGANARPHSKAELVAYARDIDWPKLGHDYLQQLYTQGHATSEFVIDKMPLNFLNIGFIRRALPQARIIYLQRNADDHALALLKHLFNEAYPWSYDLAEIDAYTNAAGSLCSAAAAQPTNDILSLKYEDLVQQPLPSLTKVADYCGLHWNDEALQCALNFQQTNKTASTTGSASQIRSALHSRSIGLAAKYQLA